VQHRAPAIVGTILGLATAAAYLVGSGREFGYDSAVTFANFIATPSMLDAFSVHSQQPTIPIATIAGNDHVLLSLLSHFIYSLTGTRSEVVYRIVPALAAGGAVGVTTAVLIARFGAIAGACAGLYVATDPLFVDNSRDLRGYSLAALCAVLATVLLARPLTGWRRWAYGLLLGLAIAAHVFAGLVLIAHVVWAVTRNERVELWRLAPAWLLAGAVGLAADGNILWIDFTEHGLIPGAVDPTFPRDLVFYLVGAPVLLTIGLWLSTAGLGLWVLRRERWLWTSVITMSAAVLILWLGLHPAYLFPRFFVFLVPGCAYLVAAAVKRWKVLAPVVLLGAAAAVAFQVPGYAGDELALRQSAAVVEDATSLGRRACVLHSDEQILGAYATGFFTVTSADQLQTCDLVVVVSWGVDLPLRDLAAQEFPRARALGTGYPAIVLER
jgi:lipoprotein signal peptidase